MYIRLPKIVLLAISVLAFASLLVAFAYGVLVQREKVFPYSYVAKFESAINWSMKTTGADMPWYYRKTSTEERIWQAKSFADMRLNLITSMGSDDEIKITVMASNGEVLNDLSVNWFEIWPNPEHLPVENIPRSRPGTHIHGIVMLPNGDVVFNFEQLGLVRMTPCGNVVWKLAYRTHHSVFADEDGTLWVAGQITHQSPLPEYPNHRPPFREPTVLQVSPEGQILREISVFDVLVKNDLRGFLHLVTPSNRNTVVTGDTLHLNDVEIFPTAMEEGVFRHGDIMISLRNVSTVLVFDPDTYDVRYRATGFFSRQHDPDFIDGNRLSIFDNNHIGPESFGQQSRILIISVDSDSKDIWYEGSEDKPFYTDIMGKAQWLKNDALLVTDSRNGRAFQLNADREIAWEYTNLVGNGLVGLVEEVQRLPAAITPIFYEPQSARCQAN